MTTEVHCLVKHNGTELELQSETVEKLTEKLSQSQFDYFTMVCILGEPSSAKTSIMNAIIKYFRVNCGLTESDDRGGFLQPKKVQNEGERLDGILVSTPPFMINDNLGGSVAILLLDVWNKFSECEEVYAKLVDFCFLASSPKVFSLLGPFQQVPWWSGSFEGSSCSPELKQVHSYLKTKWKAKQDDVIAKTSTGSGSSAIAVKMCWKDESEYFPVIIPADEGGTGLNQYEDCFNFILEQIVVECNHGHCCKPSQFKDHLIKCVTRVNSSEHLGRSSAPASHPHHDAVAVNIEGTSGSQQILEAYKKRLLQVYSDSPQLFLRDQELKDCSNGFSDELGIDREEVFRTCEGYYGQLKQFHEVMQSSFELIKTEVVKVSDKSLIFYEKTFASGFKKHLEDYEVVQEMKNLQGNVSEAAKEMTDQVLKTIGSSQCPLKNEIEILSSKLKLEIRQKLLHNLEELQKQVQLAVQTYGAFKSTLDERIQSSVCLPKDKFEEAAERAWEAMEATENGIKIRPLLSKIRDEAVQEYEDKLRERKEQVFNSEICLAKQATNFVADFLFKLLMDYLKKFGVLTDREVTRAFTVASSHAKKAFLSVPVFDYSPPWHEAVHALPSVLENGYGEVRQINLNAIRRWDRALESALRKIAEFYSHRMDEQLSKHKISRKELEKLHEACAEKTVAEFTVGSEVNEPTKKYWKKLLKKNQLEEWKEGYVCVNDDNKHVERASTTLFSDVVKMGENYRENRGQSEDRPKIARPKTPPQPQSPNCPVSHVGVYFGPEIIIFTALRPDGDEIHVPIAPFALCSNSKIFYGGEALQAARNTGQLFDIFAILTNPTVPLEQPCTMKFNGKSVWLTAEAPAVLFFKHAVSQIIVQTGCGIGSCAVALPGLLPSAAKTAVKEALKLAGFSRVIVVPFTTALALPVALSLESEWRDKTFKKIVTIYHVGSILEAALLHASPGKLQVKKLHGSLNLVNTSNHLSYTRSIIEEVATKDLYATMTLVGEDFMPAVKESLSRALNEMDSLKCFGIRYGSKENGSRNSTTPAEISVTMAKLDDTLSDSATANGRLRFPDFNYLKPYYIKLPKKVRETLKSNEKTDVYKYFHRNGIRDFHIHEDPNGRQWNYKFDLNPQSPDGLACLILYFRDGTFRIRAPTDSSDSGLPVHSSSCKLLTVWDQEVVKRNVERVTKLMGMKDTEPSKAVEVKTQKVVEVQESEPSVNLKLNQLIGQVEDGLKNSGLAQGPVYDFINESLQECRQLLKNPSSTDQSLTVAMRKLKIRSSELLKN